MSRLQQVIFAGGLLFALVFGLRFHLKQTPTPEDTLPPASLDSIHEGARASDMVAPSATETEITGDDNLPKQSQDNSLEVNAEELEAIRQESIAWLHDIIRANTHSPTALYFSRQRLSLALSDERAREAFQQYLLETIGNMPGAELLCESAMVALSTADAVIFRDILEKAILEEKWMLVAPGIKVLAELKLPVDDFMNLVRQAAAGDSYSQYCTVLAVANHLPTLNSQEAAALLGRIYSQEDQSIANASQAYFASASNGMYEFDRDFAMFERKAFQSQEPAMRYLGLVQALGVAHHSINEAENEATACERATECHNLLLDSLKDPSPFVRFLATRYYVQYEDSFHQVLSN